MGHMLVGSAYAVGNPHASQGNPRTEPMARHKIRPPEHWQQHAFTCRRGRASAPGTSRWPRWKHVDYRIPRAQSNAGSSTPRRTAELYHIMQHDCRRLVNVRAQWRRDWAVETCVSRQRVVLVQGRQDVVRCLHSVMRLDEVVRGGGSVCRSTRHRTEQSRNRTHKQAARVRAVLLKTWGRARGSRQARRVKVWGCLFRALGRDGQHKNQ
ncbi:hypothetical protein CYLTODRAFT_180185 [Cylindrobasidium torrendii FP15055 ss-10]|uniref:Uncharacterized protein n=1 Tax=Cylindrobasidium torrendii FP15055 ss-10 TaxID=1314674 RepID=A0A0D7AWJ8_9AGAR|nr:hypothetical protein CYLTODRAFT_180185 [Cylindrobasidium torrendii FP15055 ss-10]